MNRYLLLHAKPTDTVRIAPVEMMEIVARHRAWAQDLAEGGRQLGGEKLTDDGGRHLHLRDGKPLATDGPYAEAHDLIGGFYLIQAADDAQAEAIAAGCPHLHRHQWIELRRAVPIE